MRVRVIGLLFSLLFFGGSASAYDPYDPKNCNGAGWDGKSAPAVAKVAASPRVNFVKSPYDDDFKAETCPTAAEGCRKKSYLVTGDLVFVGEVLGDFTCVSYQRPLAKENLLARGWLPSAALTPAAPMPSPQPSDWIGVWYRQGGGIEIKQGDGGQLRIEGEMFILGKLGVHHGLIKAQAAPGKDTIAFVDGGAIPFNFTDALQGECRVLMQRIGPWLMAVDNGGCGGAGGMFTGLYRRETKRR